MAVLGVVIGLDRTHSHRLYHIMYLTPPPPHLTHACPRTLINHLAFLHRASLATILQHKKHRVQHTFTRSHHISDVVALKVGVLIVSRTADNRLLCERVREQAVANGGETAHDAESV